MLTICPENDAPFTDVTLPSEEILNGAAPYVEPPIHMFPELSTWKEVVSAPPMSIVPPLMVPLNVPLVAVISPVLLTLNGAVALFAIVAPSHIFPVESTWNDVASSPPMSNAALELGSVIELNSAAPLAEIFQPEVPAEYDADWTAEPTSWNGSLDDAKVCAALTSPARPYSLNGVTRYEYVSPGAPRFSIVAVSLVPSTSTVVYSSTWATPTAFAAV